ncbi:MAG: YaaL family protein [Clostridiales bacterium]|nr:YaaL family protein [Clostridiales bacterium]MCD8110420.1 YaaL family protein [Clostridiales bacterium]MCD8133184.1 YaaL family protein [Clostridiales bacterium]
MKRRKHPAPETPQPGITEAIRQAKAELDSAYINLDHALDPDLIDCYIYQLKSAQMRYHFLLHCAKDEEFSLIYRKHP